MSTESQNHHAHTVIVPLANPATADALLTLAGALTSPDEGRIVGLFVSTGETEQQAVDLAELEKVVEAHANGGGQVSLNKQVATSVTRGIMDAVREEGADLLVLGARRKSGHFQLGTINENVAESAPCSVLIYRAGQKKEIERIVVPVDGASGSRSAAQMGILLAERLNIPVEAVHAQGQHNIVRDADARVSLSLRGLPGQEIVRRSVIPAESPAEGVLKRLDDETLVIVGFADDETLDQGVHSPFIEKMLNRAPGPVLVVIRQKQRQGARGFIARALSRIQVNLTEFEQDETEWYGDRMASPSLDFFVLAIVAATLASVGLLLNSAAVIIGAMLVAPLMQPLIGFAVGLASGHLKMVWRGLTTLLLGILTGLIVAFIVAEIVQTQVLTPEILGRTNPSIADLVVALASGVIGAYATVRKDIPGALAGVAIAAALMPPLCVIGLNIAFGNVYLAEKAALLFLTNIVAISIAALLCFLWVGIRLRAAWVTQRRWRLIVGVVVVLALAGIIGIGVLVTRSNDRPRIEDRLRQVFAPAEVVSIEIVPDRPTRIVVTLRSVEPIPVGTVRQAEQQLNQDLAYDVQLQAVVETLLDPGES